MNLFRATIDTRHPNSVVANINQFDDATLELQILSDGQVSNPWLNPKFRLVGIKRDGNEVEQSGNIELINANDHIIRIKLKEQMVTCRGIVKMQLIITEGDRTSTSIFYLSIAQSLENKIIESHRDVKTLDDLEAYIAQGREVIANAEEIVTNLQSEMSEFNEDAKSSESERQANELNRASKELIRIDNEEDRVANETERVANEEIRVENEEDRVANEQDRVVNETNRRIAENTRNAQERARQEAENERNAIFEENENFRKENEKCRIANENDRKKKFDVWEERETTRLKSEENRILQEQERNESEEIRQNQEKIRQQQESHRQQTYNQFNDSESTRQTNEVERQRAEQQRAQAELTRNETFNQSQDDRNRQYAESEETRNNAFEQNEANRQEEYTQAERERVESEELRKAREREREDAESQRQSAETQRDNAESQRIENFNQAIANANSTMNEAVANINQAIADSNTTMTAIENRADACIPIIEQSADEITGARVDYTGTTHASLRQANDANVEYVLGEVNTMRYEGQHITAHNSLAGQAKNAVVEGMTLVNLVPNKIIDYVATSDYDGVNFLGQHSNKGGHLWKVIYDLKPNTKYFISCYVETFDVAEGQYYLLNNRASSCVFDESIRIHYRGLHKWILTSKTEFTESVFIALRCQNSNARGAIKIKNIMIIEYQEGMENWDIPYFEGMTSVKSLALKSVGKNLANVDNYISYPNNTVAMTKESENSYIVESKKEGVWQSYIVDKIMLKANTTYTLSYDYKILSSNIGLENVYVCLRKDLQSSTNVSGDCKNGIPRSFTPKEDVIVRLCLYASDGTPGINKIRFSNIQVEESTAKTEHEQYKSHSITTPDDLALRGIGDVKDTLDIAKGEKVERIVERVLNGSENWQNNEFFSNTLSEFRLNLKTKIKGIITDRFIQGGAEERVAFLEDGGLHIRVLKTKLSSDTVEGFKEWLANNNLTIQYVLAEPITTKIDLSDNHVYSYADTTHYSFEVPEGSLIPTLSIDVPTNLPAVVTRQNNTITELENENKALKTEIKETSTSSVNGDLELMSQQFDLDFRIFEIETTLDIPTQLNLKGVKNMAMTVFQQAQTLILAGKYDREDMEYKLTRYLDKNRITKTEYDELIAMMDAQELMK